MKNYTLVIVSARSIVVRDYDSVNVELTHELAACTSMMRHTLVVQEGTVIFEHKRGEKPYAENKEGYALVKKILHEKKEIRVLSEREIRAIEKVHFHAI